MSKLFSIIFFCKYLAVRIQIVYLSITEDKANSDNHRENSLICRKIKGTEFGVI